MRSSKLTMKSSIHLVLLLRRNWAISLRKWKQHSRKMMLSLKRTKKFIPPLSEFLSYWIFVNMQGRIKIWVHFCNTFLINLRSFVILHSFQNFSSAFCCNLIHWNVVAVYLIASFKNKSLVITLSHDRRKGEKIVRF